MTTFPGGTSLTRVSVYDGGGTPHLHTTSTEAYVVIGGTGAVQTLDPTGFRETPLEPGSTVWFTPGVIHRAINHGGLELIVIMSNAGLPESGDAVMTFPPAVVGDPDRYRSAATLTSLSEESVRARRELAVAGFERLRKGGLEDFYDLAAALVRPRVEQWREIVRAQPPRADARLDALAAGDARHLREAAVFSAPESDPRGWGMCGRLGTHDVSVLTGVAADRSTRTARP
ncbi:cupin domain-containing protein [Actinoplanes sp. HUAS TT8]|uniref:cupin domain-containing protein n=1 Tax=Actinoplanes sp. HUAS TT8 TaxID=3447453 RepID=UPI003F5227C4